MVEVFRRRVIWMLVEKELLNKEFTIKLLAWKHSGFSIDNPVRILDDQAQGSLSEYISRPPIDLKKIRYEPVKGRVLFHTKYSQYFKENVRTFDALDFLAEAHSTKPFTASSGSSRRELHSIVPPKRTQLIRCYGLYSSRIRGLWEKMPYLADRAPAGWRQTRDAESDFDALGYTPMSEIKEAQPSARKRAWARLIAKVYEIDPLICPECGSEMKCS